MTSWRLHASVWWKLALESGVDPLRMVVLKLWLVILSFPNTKVGGSEWNGEVNPPHVNPLQRDFKLNFGLFL